MNTERTNVDSSSIKSGNSSENKNILRTSWNYCQACLNNDNKTDNFKDMMQSYLRQDSTEIYSEMMNYCFALQIGASNREMTENVYLICQSCIKSLRLAVIFRRQVEDAQKNIKNMFQENEKALQLAAPKLNEDSSDTEFSRMERNKLLSFLDDEDSTSTDESIPKRETVIKKKQIKNHSKKTRRKFIKTMASCMENTLKMVKEISHLKVWTHKPIKIEPLREISTGEKAAYSDDSKSEELFDKEDNLPIARISSKYHHLPYVLDKCQLQCKICNVTFETHRNLQIHMPEHFPNFFCSHCGRGFANRAQLTRHENIHSTERFECPHCPGKLFKTNESKYEHIKRKHSDNPTIHRCPHCNDNFVSYYLRQKHLMKAHGETKKQREFKCKQCSKTFSTTSHRSIHVRRLHLNERNHTCNTCGKAFFSNQCLSRHMVMHTEDKKFPCHICSKSFQRKYTLTEHLKTHKNEKS